MVAPGLGLVPTVQPGAPSTVGTVTPGGLMALPRPARGIDPWWAAVSFQQTPGLEWGAQVAEKCKPRLWAPATY